MSPFLRPLFWLIALIVFVWVYRTVYLWLGFERPEPRWPREQFPVVNTWYLSLKKRLDQSAEWLEARKSRVPKGSSWYSNQRDYWDPCDEDKEFRAAVSLIKSVGDINEALPNKKQIESEYWSGVNWLSPSLEEDPEPKRKDLSPRTLPTCDKALSEFEESLGDVDNHTFVELRLCYLNTDNSKYLHVIGNWATELATQISEANNLIYFTCRECNGEDFYEGWE